MRGFGRASGARAMSLLPTTNASAAVRAETRCANEAALAET
jgi:hypothetical protein